MMMSDEKFKELSELKALIDQHGVRGTAEILGKAPSTISESKKRFQIESDRRARLAESGEQQSRPGTVDQRPKYLRVIDEIDRKNREMYPEIDFGPPGEPAEGPFTLEDLEAMGRAIKEGERQRREANTARFYRDLYGYDKRKEQ
jgi:hypothetical protein